jgi:hypothetical protein
MFKQIFRLTFVTFVWKQYKQIIVSTLLLFGFLWLAGSIHEDYLNYADQLNDQALASQSFIYKWIALCAGVLIYLAYHFFRIRVRNSKTGAGKNKAQAKGQSSSNTSMPLDDNDPFAEIRIKKKLRSRAEMMIDQEPDQ